MLFIEFLKNNLGTLFVLAIVVFIVVMLSLKLIRDKRAGKSSCSCGCSSCAMRDKCGKDGGAM